MLKNKQVQRFQETFVEFRKSMREVLWITLLGDMNEILDMQS